LAGQHNIFENSRENLFNQHNKRLIKQVDLWYIQDKFAIETEYKEEKALHEYLLKEMYKTDDCEVLDFLNKKLRGALGDENVDVVDLQTMQIKYRDINNYYYSAANYEIVEF
jgi:hypothetical protein